VICDAFVALLVYWDDVIISKALKTKCGDILSTFTVVILCDSRHVVSVRVMVVTSLKTRKGKPYLYTRVQYSGHFVLV
jgi:hypothetical protein